MSFDFLKYKIENSFLSKDALSSSGTGDGRLDSAESESDVIKHLHSLFDDTEVKVVDAPKPRFWYDVFFELDGKRYYTNVKVTTGKQSDNVSSKFGLFYTLTGILPDEVNENINNWGPYNKKLLENLNYNTDADYYFVIYFKESQTFLVTSLKRIQTLSSNGSNLPFQCKWSSNHTFSNRTLKEQCDYILNVYYDSWTKKVAGFVPLMNWRQNIV